jgi:hypothetical protein
MKSFFAWFQNNSTQIAWFLIGFFVYGAVDNVAIGLVPALISCLRP